ncbi:IucA/IucC family protein [Streptomyces aidingensis]|uniref:Siderophore synthetase component n=1 Tax=Streptomyces aidingensis TaxID=910347 RepID=A0A1I1JPU8_9ACTN|nr:IucA/IucC family protein [Streptomyces aidingensis]SFC47410.1 Siderophore synthetase component [Streptomyces aidingensis]
MTMHPPSPGPDPLDHPDALLAGDAAATETLLRAYLRETGTAVPPAGQRLLLDLPASGVRLSVPVRYRSPTGWHRLGRAEVLPAGAPADAALVAAALIRQTTAGRGLPPHPGTDAVARVLNSARRTAVHLAAARRAGDAGEDAQAGPRPDGFPAAGFLAGEQALLLGHPFHPAPKSREEASDRELAAYSPELRGSFPLHWFAADPSVVTGESWDGGDPAALLAPLAPGGPGGPGGPGLPPGTVPVPAHPWQAREIMDRPEVADLLSAGLLRPLGPGGPAWWPTSSVRTVHRPDAEVMLKLSLGMRITNSRRNNLRPEMRLGVRAARLLAAGPAGWLRAEHPEFSILRDFAWISVGGGPDGTETGLETAIRDNPFRSGPGSPHAVCVAGLLAERTGPGDGSPPRHRALLAAAVERTAAAHRLSGPQAAARWYARYLEVLAVPLIRLQARYGIALEPHHQNTLVGLDPADALPCAAWYRDSQGYYLAASRAGELERLLPGAAEGVELVFEDAFVDERVAYYLGINNLLGVIGAFGALGLADEAALLAVARRTLGRLRAAEPGAKGLLDLLLDAPVLRCKGNYLTCVDGLDELVGEVHSQSVYIDLPNPFAAS